MQLEFYTSSLSLLHYYEFVSADHGFLCLLLMYTQMNQEKYCFMCSYGSYRWYAVRIALLLSFLTPHYVLDI